MLDGQIVYSAIELNNYLACEQLTTPDLAVAQGVRERPGQAEHERSRASRQSILRPAAPYGWHDWGGSWSNENG